MATRPLFFLDLLFASPKWNRNNKEHQISEQYTPFRVNVKMPTTALSVKYIMPLCIFIGGVIENSCFLSPVVWQALSGMGHFRILALSWNWFATEDDAKTEVFSYVTRGVQLSLMVVPRNSFHCKLAPVQSSEYENDLLFYFVKTSFVPDVIVRTRRTKEKFVYLLEASSTCKWGNTLFATLFQFNSFCTWFCFEGSL